MTARAPGLRFGYGTNGLADHRLDDALDLLAAEGYDGVALTVDVRHLDPFAADLDAVLRRLRARLESLGLGVVIETGARYLLDPRRKHQPTLLSDEGREARLDLLRRAIDIGAALGAEAVSYWSGTPEPHVPEAVAWDRLREGSVALLDHAERVGTRLALEPEPGMLLDRLDAFCRLVDDLDGDPRLGLTLDVGHCHCLEDDSVPDCVRRAAGRLANVQIEDMRRGVHEHLWFGEGEMDFPPLLDALSEIGYQGLVSVELPRHSHAAGTLVPAALEFLRAAAGQGGRA